jgi:hypothetical protein
VIADILLDVIVERSTRRYLVTRVLNMSDVSIGGSHKYISHIQGDDYMTLPCHHKPIFFPITLEYINHIQGDHYMTLPCHHKTVCFSTTTKLSIGFSSIIAAS